MCHSFLIRFIFGYIVINDINGFHAESTHLADRGELHVKTYNYHFTTPTNTQLLNRHEVFSFANQTLHDIMLTEDKMNKINKAISLGSTIAKINSTLLSNPLRSYLYNILSNITYDGDINSITLMLRHLTNLYESETNSSLFDYAKHRMMDTDEQRLLRTLLTNYEKAVRPVIRASDTIDLKIGLTLNQIDVDEKNQVLKALVWLDQEWRDEKLVWDPRMFSNLSVIRIPCEKLWLPDVILYNSVNDMVGGYMQALTMVTHNGNVFWPPIVKFQGNCEILIQYFPFDDQLCKLKLGSWAYDGLQVNLTKRRSGIDLANFQPNGEWMLLQTSIERNEVFYPCCTTPYIDLTFSLFLRRRTLYYTYNIIIPCVMLSILTMLCFWMNPDSGEKINLGLTILLAFSVFMLLIAESMPSTSLHIPIIGIYITSSMCITAFSVIVSVLVANINRQAEGNKAVPRWLHTFVYALSKVACIQMASWEERNYNIRQLAKNVFFPIHPKVSDGQKGVIHRDATESSTNHEKNNLIDNEVIQEDSLLVRLHSIIEHQEQLLHKQTRTQDWHMVSIVIDRCFFWIYLLMILSATIGCLVVFPMTKDKPSKF